MARSRRNPGDDVPELNLAPIMNMVVILIPLLLLSVVFLKVGVINISTPQLSMGPPSDTPPPDEEPLNLTVAVNEKGFRIAATGALLPEMAGCPVPGPTICLEDQSADVGKLYADARAKFASGQSEAGELALDAALKAYNWKELYNQLVRIKGQYEKETVVKISADPDIPYAAVVLVIDVARYKLAKDSYSKTSEFWAAQYATGASGPEHLFFDPALAVAQ
ncbi:MAG: biopolymer transporter ExbD [Planctomycetota bacterium]|jgi:biopolymer transport protein ExbD